MATRLQEDIQAVNNAVKRALTDLFGPEPAEHLDRLLDLCESEKLDDAASLIAGLPDETVARLVQAITIRFHLRNKAEQLAIARINRERGADPTKLRPESIAETVETLRREQGVGPDRLAEILAKVDVQPTLTAHPTEARRRTILGKQQRAAEALSRLADPLASAAEIAEAESDLCRCVTLLFTTDEVRLERLRVLEEVRNGLYFLAGSIWDTVPRIHRDLRDAGVETEIPPFIRYRSWIGGDRDGNPNVTADVTRETLDILRDAAMDRYLEELEYLRRDLSVSSRQVDAPQDLLDSIEADERLGLIEPDVFRHRRREPFRMKIMLMKAKLEQAKGSAEAYTAEQFLADLELLDRSLRAVGLPAVATEGPLADTLCRARTFGLHLASLDIRQHSARHESAVSELLAEAGVEQDYAALDEPARLELLTRELQNPRPLVRTQAPLSDDTTEVLRALKVVAEGHAREPESIGSVIVSMTHEISDLLEPMLLLKEIGFAHLGEDGLHCPVDLVPLFETVDDLARSASLMRELFANPVYAAHLKRRGSFQELMLGYSDSNKDGGYWIANVSLQNAQRTLAEVCQEHGIDFRFFHGRGGTVGRGGGRAGRAIRATPAVARNGRIRFTEQGEVITFRYAMAPIAHRHVEQIVGGALLTAANNEPDYARGTDLLDRVGQRAMEAYRGLIDHDDFWSYYASASPVAHIARLPLASRPVARAAGALKFDSLRAIPWVFAWTQMRATVPGWFGLGTAVGELSDAEKDELRELYTKDAFVTMLIDNAQQELARSRIDISERYATRAEAQGFFERVRSEFDRSVDAILEITQQNELLESRSVIRQSIEQRNPATDALNLIQLDLLTRFERAETDEQRQKLEPIIHSSINGVAAAMQATG